VAARPDRRPQHWRTEAEKRADGVQDHVRIGEHAHESRFVGNVDRHRAGLGSEPIGEPRSSRAVEIADEHVLDEVERGGRPGRLAAHSTGPKNHELHRARHANPVEGTCVTRFRSPPMRAS
jgi:hypothetical protein